MLTTLSALKANFEKQVPLLEAQYNAANAQLTAIGETEKWQQDTYDVLVLIQRALALAIPDAPQLPPAVPSAASGADIVKGGLINVHDGERILSAVEAARIETDPDLNNWNSIYS